MHGRLDYPKISEDQVQTVCGVVPSACARSPWGRSRWWWKGRLSRKCVSDWRIECSLRLGLTAGCPNTSKPCLLFCPNHLLFVHFDFRRHLDSGVHWKLAEPGGLQATSQCFLQHMLARSFHQHFSESPGSDWVFVQSCQGRSKLQTDCGLIGCAGT